MVIVRSLFLGLRDPFQMTVLWLINWGYHTLTNWDDPWSSVFASDGFMVLIPSGRRGKQQPHKRKQKGNVYRGRVQRLEYIVSTNRSNPEIKGGVPISVTCSVWYEVMTLRDITKTWTESRSDSRQTPVSYQVTMLAALGSMGKVANNPQIQKLSFTTYISRVPQRHKHILYHELLIIFGQQIGSKPKYSNMGW